MKEKEIAEIVFQIYQELKKEQKNISQQKSSVSSWTMAERLKMFE
jgi:hypothetical protein